MVSYIAICIYVATCVGIIENTQNDCHCDLPRNFTGLLIWIEVVTKTLAVYIHS